MSPSCRRVVSMFTVLAALIAVPAQASASAACTPTGDASQVFLPWADVANYGLAPDGGVENGAGVWSLSGSAGIVGGNESFFVEDEGDSNALGLPSGSAATTAATCVGLEYPTVRFFAKSSGTSLLSSLRVDVVYTEAATGLTVSAPIGVVTPSASWQPTAPMAIVVNTLGALSEDGKVAASVRFTPVGVGAWQIDDIEVDPWRGP